MKPGTIGRREAVKIGAAFGALALSTSIGSPALAKDEPAPSAGGDALLDSWGFVSEEEALAGKQGLVGPDPARHKHVVEAFRILFKAPRNSTPFEVAEYFYNLRNDEKAKLYIREWADKREANPLVVGFFTSTRTIPSGDLTPWCAAFVNFCFMASGRSGTGSPLSGTFRATEHPDFFPVQSPKPGDIVVFWANGEQGDKGFGHVAFFQKFENSQYFTLGGNQGNAIASSAFTVPGDYKRVEFRRVR